ncbi:MAG TPA: carbohydrate ABC transporter permease [Thermofilum sp.]|nr:carbohydrate ABC transporter permease [Thermofilum sp.]
MAKMMVNRALIISVLVLLSMLFLVPMYVMVVTSLKTPYEISLAEYLSPPKFPYLSNYLKILDKMGEALIDTLIVSVSSTMICIAIGTLAGYFLARFNLRYSLHLSFIVMLASFLPYQAILIPLTMLESWLFITDTYLGLIFAYVMLNTPLSTLIPMVFFMTLPKELEEIAIVDGCGPIHTFIKVVLPISKPALASTAILVFTSVWNEFLIALTLGGTRIRMVAPSVAELKGAYAAFWNLQMAGAIIGSLPPLIFFITAGKYFVKGLLVGTMRA